MKTVVCDHCGVEFKVPDGSRAKVCMACHRAVAAKRWAEHYKPETPPTRKCHDCGAPTPDYRCQKCREKWQKKHGVQAYSLGNEPEHFSLGKGDDDDSFD